MYTMQWSLRFIRPARTFFIPKHTTALCGIPGFATASRILEVATGSGEMFRRLVKANPDGRTYGLDLSPNMAAHTLRVARKACPQAEAHCGAVDVRNLPFRAGSFDAVMCCYLLELLSQDDIRGTLREIRRVLRPGGNFSLVVIGQNVKMFNHLYTVGGSLVPAFWGRQVESSVPRKANPPKPECGWSPTASCGRDFIPRVCWSRRTLLCKTGPRTSEPYAERSLNKKLAKQECTFAIDRSVREEAHRFLGPGRLR